MNRYFVILSILFLGFQHSYAQGKLDSFRDKVLSDYSKYFSHASQGANGQLSLIATDSYTGLTTESKADIITAILTSWKDSLLRVEYGSKRELWGLSANSGGIRLLDAYDLNARPLMRTAAQSSRPNPWFFYVGGQFGGDSQNNINIALNLRFGFFLLMNRWDLATTLSGGLTGNTSYMDAGTGWGNVGFMTRVHFPIRKIRLSPNVGAEVTMSAFGSTPLEVNGSLVVGASWFVGIGNLDVAIHIGKDVSGSLGYTMMLGQKSKK
jgi:hypothetical protein